MVYDITSPSSWTRAKSWVSQLQMQGKPNMIIALVGNKSDLADDRAVSTDEAQAYANRHGLLFMETSAKTADNVNAIFESIAKNLPKERAPPKQSSILNPGSNIKTEPASSGGCCG